MGNGGRAEQVAAKLNAQNDCWRPSGRQIVCQCSAGYLRAALLAATLSAAARRSSAKASYCFDMGLLIRP